MSLISQPSWLVTNLVAALLLPPLNLLIPGIFGFYLLKRNRPWGKALLDFSLAGLWLLSTPLVAGAMLDALKPAYRALDGSEADAIVILGGGRHYDTLEYAGDTLGQLTLERVRYGAWLARRLN